MQVVHSDEWRRFAQRAAGTGAWRTDPDVPEARFVTDALRSRYGEGLVRIRTGGSFPPTGSSTVFTCRPWASRSRTSTTTSTPTTRISRPGNLWNGILTLAAIMTK